MNGMTDINILRKEGLLPEGYIPAKEWQALNGLTTGQASGLLSTNQVNFVKIFGRRYVSVKSTVRRLPPDECSYNKSYEVIKG